MNNKREEIPYDEDGKQLSFNTDAETVYVDGVPLKSWLQLLETRLSNMSGSDGQNGASFAGFQTDYAAVSEANNNLDYVKSIMTWSSSSPALTQERPHLWKRQQTKTQQPDGAVVVTSVTYEYCGGLGKTGLDAEWKEWIFRITPNNKPEADIRAELMTQLDAYYTTAEGSSYQQNDFVPAYWKDDMQEVTNENSLQWCASRYKKNGLWSKFGNLHVFGRKPLDGVTCNNIYTVTNDIEEAKWESDKAKLIDSITLNMDSGTIQNFPKGTNYTWVDFVPNTSSEEVIFQATAYFQNQNCVNIDAPFRITGPEGPGSDGNGVEFVYCALDNSDPEDGEFPPFYPTEKHYDTVNGGWFDSAGDCPISPETPYQYMRHRQGHYTSEYNWCWKDGDYYYGVSPTGTFNGIEVKPAPASWDFGWSKPQLWSSWGVDGVDGDGVQYVYVRLTEAEYQFVSKDKSRWNFDGQASMVDPGELDQGINYTYSYILDETVFDGGYVDWDATSLYLTNVSGKYTITDENGVVIMGPASFKINFDVDISSEDFNYSISGTKDCSYEFTYNGDALPNNKFNKGEISGTVLYKRTKCPQENYTYHIYYVDIETDEHIKSDITNQLPIHEKLKITAPTIEGYTIEGNAEDEISPQRPTVTFYYRKNE